MKKAVIFSLITGVILLLVYVGSVFAKSGHPGPKHGPQFYSWKVHRQYYWYPYYPVQPSARVWGDIGYRYYFGGMDYVITPTASTVKRSEVHKTVVADMAGDAEERLVQLQALTDMIHTWRTMNESPEFHARIPAGKELPENIRKTLANLKEENRSFDESSRAAMRDLAAGKSAAINLEAAQKHLEALTKLADSLPESKKSPAKKS